MTSTALEKLGLTQEDVDKAKNTSPALAKLGLTQEDVDNVKKSSADKALDLMPSGQKDEVMFAQGLVKSMTDLGIGLAETGSYIHDKISGDKSKYLPSILSLGKKVDDQYKKNVGDNSFASAGYAAGTLAQLVAPLGAIKILEAPAAFANASKGAKLLSYMGKNALVGGGYAAATYNPEGNVGEKVLEGATIAGLLSPAIPAGENIYNYLGKLKFIVPGGEQTTQKLLDSQQALGKEGIANIFSASGSYGRQKMVENVVGSIPLSGIEGRQKAAVDQLNSRTTDVLKTLSANVSGATSLDEQNVQNLINTYEREAGLSKDVYSQIDKMAKKQKAFVEPTNARKAAKSVEAYIKDLKTPMRYVDGKGTRQKSVNESIASEFSVLTGYLDQLKEKGAFNFSTIKRIRSKILEQSRKATKSGDKTLAAKFTELDQGIEDDMNKAAKVNPELHTLWRDANEHYRKTIMPYFSENDLARYTTKRKPSGIVKGDPNMFVSTFIRPSGSIASNDRDILIDQIVSRISPEAQDTLGYTYLTKSLPDPGSNKMQNISQRIQQVYERLGKNQQTALFRPEIKEQLDALANSVRINDEALTAHQNPKTGAQVKPFLATWGTGIGLTGGGLAAGGLLGGLTTLSAILGGSRLAVNLAYSPKVREFIIKQRVKPDRSLKNLLSKKNNK